MSSKRKSPEVVADSLAIGRYIKEMRIKHLGISRHQLALRADVSATNLKAIEESGYCFQVNTLIKLSNIFRAHGVCLLAPEIELPSYQSRYNPHIDQ